MKLIVFFFFTLLTLLFVSCGDYIYAYCYPQVNLAILNNDTCDYFLKFTDLHESKSSILIKDTTIYINKGEAQSNVINYDYTITDSKYCFFCKGHYKHFLKIKIEIMKITQIQESFFYYPWDTTSVFNFPEGSVYMIYDTLVLP